ncbi:MAG: DNA repair protein RecN [Myxococcota bacterium]
MIETLRIENLAVIDSAELEFGPGLNVLTGETGAGKSIVLGALALLAGARASADAVREGADEAAVEAVFRTIAQPEFEAELARRGLEADAHELVVRRTLTRGGRNRVRVAGQLVPASVLSELFSGRIEISSQHESQGLLRPEVHGELLDRSGGLLEGREAVSGGYASLKRLEQDLDRHRAESQERERRRDFLSFQIEEIDEAKLDPDEIEALKGERGRLAHAEQLREEGGAALAGLAGDPTRPEDSNAADLLVGAARRLELLAGLDPSLADLSGRLAFAQTELRDAALELERYVASIEADPARLEGIDERLHRVERLQRKYGGSVAEILSFRDESAAELAGIEDAREREEQLLRQRGELRARLARDAVALTRGRVRAGRGLARIVEASLHELDMPEARFEVAFEPVEGLEDLPCGPHGAERPIFCFSANAGTPPRPLRRVVSGGELSRAFLAIKNALRESDAGMVLVFDEVDAGIGGRAADRVGRKLAELARSHQVLCITHLPQIAAYAGTHFRVEKQSPDNRAQARIIGVEGADRVEEIARMAGGESVGEATRRHARDLLNARAETP